MPTESFFACYLLTPELPPRRLRCSYVGFTVSPARRIRQHNGELAGGAKRTAKYRPWEMLGVVHGFPTKFHALQFEWAWQHPHVSRFTREHLSALQGAKGVGAPGSVKRKLREMHEMLHLPPWAQFPLTVSYTSGAAQETARALLGAHYRWPAHMTCETRPLADFARRRTRQDASAGSEEDAEDEDVDPDACFICERALEEAAAAGSATTLRCYHRDCPLRCHTLCLADHFVATADAEPSPARIRPERGDCPCCARELLWPRLTLQTRGQALGAPGASVTNTTARKRRRQENPERGGVGSAAASEHRQNLQSTERSRQGPGGQTDAVASDASHGFDDAGWFEEDDDDDSFIEYLSGSRSEDRDGAYYDRADGSFGEDTRAQRVVGRPAPVVVDLTLDDDDDDGEL